MAQAIPRERVLNVLQRRYDHQSAQVVFKRAVESVKLRDQEEYTREELQSISEGLKKVGDRLDSLIGPLMALAGTAATPPQARQSPTPEAQRAEPRPEGARAQPTPQPPRAPDAASVVAVTPATITPSQAPAVAPASTTAKTHPGPGTAEPSSTTTDATAASDVASTEDAPNAQHEDGGDTEGDSTDSGGAGEREAKGRPRRKR